MATDNGRRSVSGVEAQDTVPELCSAGVRDPLCHLATNKDSKGVQGKWRLILAIILCTLFMVGEVVGGIYAHSLAVLTDAAHMLSDVLAFAISLGAGTYALRASKGSHTFGYHRAEVLGSMVSVLIIWVVTGILVYEAVLRVTHPERVDGKLMFILAVTGIAVNILNLFILGGHGHNHGHSDEDAEAGNSANGHQASAHAEAADSHAHGASTTSLGMRGAFIHVLGDCVQSFGVVIAAIIIWVKPEYHIADPICTFVFAIAVLCTTRGMVRDITDIVMERVPRGFDFTALEAALRGIPGVHSMHDLHVWALKPSVVVLAAHVDLAAGSDPAAVLRGVTQCCSAAGVQHSTVQLSAQGEPCLCNTESIKHTIAAGLQLH